jgi:replication factor C small subunit
MEYSIWTEKYRPRDFSEMKGQKEIVSRIKAFVEQKNMPHLLFTGPPGIGKTTLSLIIARQLFGDNWRQNFLELNASDERGIDVVRVKVKDFARTKAIGDVPFKIIYLDECDALTREAQQALRRTMENYTNTCRFILSANYSSKIIDPIQSRCAIFRFKPLAEKEILDIIEGIAKHEKLKIDADTKKALFDISEGDVRKLENVMQSASVLSKDITEKDLYAVSESAKPQDVRKMLDTALKGDFVKAREELLQTMLENGLSGQDMIKHIHKEIWNLKIDDSKKIILVDKCAEIEFRMTEGSDEYLQLESLLAQFVSAGIKK